MARVALVTATAALGTDEDLEPLLDALIRRGMTADAPCWDDAEVDWESFDLAVLRSPWDYVPRYAEFLRWLDATGAQVQVLNPSSVVRWSTDKRYLADLAARGVPVVPTEFFEPGGPPPRLSGRSGELVVKPIVSAGSRDTARHSDPHAAERHALDLLAADRGVMVQPYLAGIDTHGETGLVYFDGELSHAFRKAPLLALDAPPTSEFYAPEEITARVPTPDERRIADLTIAGCGGAELLYGRVDLVPGPDGQPVVLEVELAEPSYFVAQDPEAADRFAAAVERRVLGKNPG
jgi:O-ureido-D-serine cyclo-ligase